MKKFRGIFIKNEREIALLRKANGMTAAILDELVANVRPGVPTMLFEDKARARCEEWGVRPSFLGYCGFPFALCCSVNETVVHGFPSKERILQEGDMVSFANELKESWEAKKRTSSIISNPKIEEDYKFIMENGGIAAKVSGAGGGGFMMIICDPIKKYALQSKLKERGGKVFSAKFTKEGTEGWVIYDK